MTTNKRWIRVAECEKIPVREGRSVMVAGREVALFNLGDRFLAVENRCPHRGGTLADGIVSGTTVVCPLHAWKVNLKTGAVANPPGELTCVNTFRVRVEEGCVLLEIPADAQATQELLAPAVDQQEPPSCLNSSVCSLDAPEIRNVVA